MAIYPCRNFIIKIFLILFIALVSRPSLFAQQESDLSIGNKGRIQSKIVPERKKGTVYFDKEGLKEKNLTALQVTARKYREQGYEFQRAGKIDEAMVFYQKAVMLDPVYSVAYNDLGIIFESKGMIERAQESYLKAIQTDPIFLSPYTNLAIMYERKHDLDKARYYWQKRAQMGPPTDPWTRKAWRHLEDLHVPSSERPLPESEKKPEASPVKEAVSPAPKVVTETEKKIPSKKPEARLAKETMKPAPKIVPEKDPNLMSNRHFEAAKKSYSKGDYATAIMEALEAKQLNPSNKEIDKFIEEAQLKALSK